MKSLLRQIPQISKVVEIFAKAYPEIYVVKAAREVAEKYRKEIIEGARADLNGFLEDVERKIKSLMKPNIKRVINATGVVINTNLGRAPLSKDVINFISEIANGYSNLEYNLEEGKRGSRIAHIEKYLNELTGAESSFVVNNNAGAVFLVLNTLAEGKEVIISRGELVEIGGSFRIPDIMKKSGAILREVGTTNKTKVSDYEGAINQNTALLMKVHKSNFYMEGFVEEVKLEDLVKLGHKYGIPTYYDAGSGLLINLKEFGISVDEPNFRDCISLGIDLVSGSGDKLLGGPQAGIIVGKKNLIEKIKKNPIARALRIDKLTLSGLEMTLKLYFEKRYEDIPVIRMLTQDEKALRQKAKRLEKLLKDIPGLKISVIKDKAKPGGGSLPELELPTYCVAIRHDRLSSQELSRRLRLAEPPIVCRIREDQLLFDMRTVFHEDLKTIKKTLQELLSI
uniref:L-seryl-tRNA(Sec) selenium transferase n=1 Tax=Aquifex aeolicus (strain VF5) TaxID=224324 RepID=UPI000334902A